MELDDDHGDGGDQKKISSAPTLKRRKRQIKWAQGKGIFNRTFCFVTQDTKWVSVDLG